jgi:hypothetical protein
LNEASALMKEATKIQEYVDSVLNAKNDADVDALDHGKLKHVETEVKLGPDGKPVSDATDVPGKAAFFEAQVAADKKAAYENYTKKHGMYKSKKSEYEAKKSEYEAKVKDFEALLNPSDGAPAVGGGGSRKKHSKRLLRSMSGGVDMTEEQKKQFEIFKTKFKESQNKLKVELDNIPESQIDESPISQEGFFKLGKNESDKKIIHLQDAYSLYNNALRDTTSLYKSYEDFVASIGKVAGPAAPVGNIEDEKKRARDAAEKASSLFAQINIAKLGTPSVVDLLEEKKSQLTQPDLETLENAKIEFPRIEQAIKEFHSTASSQNLIADNYSKQAQGGTSMDVVTTSADRVEEAAKKVEELFEKYQIEKQKNSDLQYTLKKIFSKFGKPAAPVVPLDPLAGGLSTNNVLSFNCHGSKATGSFTLPENVYVLVPFGVDVDLTGGSKTTISKKGLDISYTTPPSPANTTFEELMYGPIGKLLFNSSASSDTKWYLYQPKEEVPNVDYRPFGKGDAAGGDAATCDHVSEGYDHFVSDLMNHCLRSDTELNKKVCVYFVSDSTQTKDNPEKPGTTTSGVFKDQYDNSHLKLKVCGPTTLKELADNCHKLVKFSKDFIEESKKSDSQTYKANPVYDVGKILPEDNKPIILMPFACNAGSSPTIPINYSNPTESTEKLSDIIESLGKLKLSEAPAPAAAPAAGAAGGVAGVAAAAAAAGAKKLDLPSPTTKSANAITKNTASTGGTTSTPSSAVNVVEKGVFYDTVQLNPPSIPATATKVQPPSTGAGSGDNDFTCELTNLKPSTKYYVVSYVKYNTASDNTIYGNQVEFITLPDAPPPPPPPGGAGPPPPPPPPPPPGAAGTGVKTESTKGAVDKGTAKGAAKGAGKSFLDELKEKTKVYSPGGGSKSRTKSTRKSKSKSKNKTKKNHSPSTKRKIPKIKMN